ncbi:hypothetical protein DFQ29_002483, partial [Apophysomyces sp. BC1021]
MVDLMSLFAEAKAEAAVVVEGNNPLIESARTASVLISKSLKQKRGSDKSLPSITVTESCSRDDLESPVNLDSHPNLDSSSSAIDSTESIILPNGFNMSQAFDGFKSMVWDKSKSRGLRLHEDIHEVLALSHILLLNEDQHGRNLIDHVGLDNLEAYHGDLRKKYLDEESIDDELFQSVSGIFRKFKDKPCKEVKTKLMQLAINANDFDTTMLDVLLNCVNKLPEYENDIQVGEQQLITNHIDPVVSPLFHMPQYGREFHCRILRSQGNDNEGNLVLHEDLFRLSNFCKDALDSGQIKAMIAVQAV